MTAAPTPMSKEGRIDHYLSIADEMGLTSEEQYWRIFRDPLRRNMAEYPEEFLRTISDEIEACSYTTECILHQITLGAHTRSADFILDCLHFHHILNNDEYLMTSSLLDLMSKYEGFNHVGRRYREGSEREQKETVALMRFVLAFRYRDSDSFDWECSAPDDLLEYDGQHMGRTYAYYIRDLKMVDLVREHCDQVDRITALIKDREVIDPEVLRELLRVDSAPAITSGVL